MFIVNAFIIICSITKYKTNSQNFPSLGIFEPLPLAVGSMMIGNHGNSSNNASMAFVDSVTPNPLCLFGNTVAPTEHNVLVTGNATNRK